MRKKLIVVFMLMISVAAYAQEESLNVYGVGAYIKSTPYKDEDVNVVPIPIVVWRNDHFFVDGQRGGWIAFENEHFRADVIAVPRLMGFDADDASSLNGMENRSFSVDGGAQLTWNIPKWEKAAVILSGVSDIGNVHGGQEITASFKKTFPFEIFQLVPEVGLKWQSKELVDYYYGVRVPEITRARAAYSAEDTWNYYFNLGFNMGLSRSKDLFLVTRIGVEFLGDQITDSPIVDKNEIVSGVVGIVKKF